MKTLRKSYAVVTADFSDVVLCQTAEGAEAAALSFGEDAHVVDTMGAPYHPAVQRVVDGQLVLLGFGSFNPKLGADANLFVAVKKKQPYAARAFLAIGANPHACEKDGATPLHWAVGRECVACIAVLMARGANLDAVDAQGQTPRGLAHAKNNAALLDALNL